MNEFALSSVLELPVEERIRIVEAIWDSVAEEPDEISLPEWQVQELDTRFAAYQKDPSAGFSWTEVKGRILSETQPTCALGMEVKERIDQYLQRLPRRRQKDILEFAKYLLQKETESTSVREEDIEWSRFSIEQAMRGMEDEEGPEYTDADLKVIY